MLNGAVKCTLIGSWKLNWISQKIFYIYIYISTCERMTDILILWKYVEVSGRLYGCRFSGSDNKLMCLCWGKFFIYSCDTIAELLRTFLRKFLHMLFLYTLICLFGVQEKHFLLLYINVEISWAAYVFIFFQDSLMNGKLIIIQ